MNVAKYLGVRESAFPNVNITLIEQNIALTAGHPLIAAGCPKLREVARWQGNR